MLGSLYTMKTKEWGNVADNAEKAPYLRDTDAYLTMCQEFVKPVMLRANFNTVAYRLKLSEYMSEHLEAFMCLMYCDHYRGWIKELEKKEVHPPAGRSFAADKENNPEEQDEGTEAESEDEEDSSSVDADDEDIDEKFGGWNMAQGGDDTLLDLYEAIVVALMKQRDPDDIESEQLENFESNLLQYFQNGLGGKGGVSRAQTVRTNNKKRRNLNGLAKHVVAKKGRWDEKKMHRDCSHMNSAPVPEEY
jgi:hypothetical protein